MPEKTYTKTVSNEGEVIRFNQTLSETLYNALDEIRAEKNFDTVQSLIRFMAADFVKKNGKKF